MKNSSRGSLNLFQPSIERVKGLLRPILISLIGLFFFVPILRAQESQQNPAPADLPQPAVPPHFLRHKPLLPQELVEAKPTGRKWFIFPVITRDPNTGLNIGASSLIYQYGDRDSPFFQVTPYRRFIQASVSVSTQKQLNFKTHFEQLFVKDSPWSIYGNLLLSRNPSENYFGIGSAGELLTFPGSNFVFDQYDSFKRAIQREVNGFTFSRFDEYLNSTVSLDANAEFNLAGGILKPYFGFKIAHVSVGDYTGATVKARNANDEKVDATQLSTHLKIDCASGTITGCDGGWDNILKLGIVVDTRDFEPDPSKGIIYELLGEFSTVAIGSSFNYGRMTTTLRAYGPLFKRGRQRLVAAGRFLFNWQFGDIPFYAMNEFASSDDDFTGLGGFKTLRGFTQDRFVAPVALLFNAELRYTFAGANFLRQRLTFTLAPFLDLGKAFDNISSVSTQDWKLGGGAGLRLNWNVSTVVSFDYGVSKEGKAFYMTLGHQF